MKSHSKQIVIATISALLLLLSSFVEVSAGPINQDPTPKEPELDCRECHWDIFMTWEASAHGQGLSCGQCHLAVLQDNHAREGHGAQSGPKSCMSCHTTGYNPVNDTWEEDNVHCTACHSPITKDHPAEPMPTNRSEQLCGQCHIEARFEWETSKHGQIGIACVSCHSQHTTSLIAEDVSDQCATCHGAMVAGFTHSEHDESGVTCADCHLAPLNSPLGSGNARLDHSFLVKLETCTSCHAYQLHNPAQTPTASSEIAFETTSIGTPDAMASNTTLEVSAEPEPVSPTGITIIAMLVGLSVGVVTAPWFSSWIQRVRG